MSIIQTICRTGTKFPARVKAVVGDVRVLKEGSNNRKLGGFVTKGEWRGFPIYTLTLEERQTCPATCLQWDQCYGNNMPFAYRWQHGPILEGRLHTELQALQAFYPEGFVVRLHILGDFYSVPYVATWVAYLDEFPALHVYGYTARQPGTLIGDALAAINHFRWKVRLSGRDTQVVEAFGPNDEGIQCPTQTKQTKKCGTCALCWSTDKLITFERH